MLLKWFFQRALNCFPSRGNQTPSNYLKAISDITSRQIGLSSALVGQWNGAGYALVWSTALLLPACWGVLRAVTARWCQLRGGQMSWGRKAATAQCSTHCLRCKKCCSSLGHHWEPFAIPVLSKFGPDVYFLLQNNNGVVIPKLSYTHHRQYSLFHFFSIIILISFFVTRWWHTWQRNSHGLPWG